MCSIWQKVTTNSKAYPSEHILTPSLIGKIHILFVNHIHFLHTNELRSWCESERKETKEFNDINKRCRVRTATIHDGPVVLDRDGPVVLKFIYGHIYVFLSVTTDCVRHWRIRDISSYKYTLLYLYLLNIWTQRTNLCGFELLSWPVLVSYMYLNVVHVHTILILIVTRTYDLVVGPF